MIRRHRWPLFVGCISTIVSTIAYAQMSTAEQRLRSLEEKSIQETTPLAQAELATLKRLALGNDYTIFGFQTRDEVSQAHLEPGIPIIDVGTDDLKRYTSGTDVASILTACTRVVFPVSTGTSVRCSVDIFRANGKWQQQAEFGSGASADALAQAVRSFGGFEGPRASFIAAVHSENVYLKGRFAAGGLQLRPVQLTSGSGVAGPNISLYSEGAPSGLGLLDMLADRAKRQNSSQRVLR